MEVKKEMHIQLSYIYVPQTPPANFDLIFQTYFHAETMTE